MRNLSDTISRLGKLAKVDGLPGTAPVGARLRALPDFGANPGALSAWTYVPEDLPTGAPLVVVLHGCTQTAAGYDHGSGWSQLAERYGFALLFPEQRRANNANLCFNWFAAEDIRRDGGEAASIRAMVARVVADHAIDPARVFVTGLSAGGAMTATMLATYPEVFAGGAIIAGQPHGVAHTMPEAFDRMRGHGLPPATALAKLVRDASGHAGPWPTVSIWHGTADTTVSHGNAEAILAQWRVLHGVGDAAGSTGMVDGQPRRAWRDGSGREVIEEYSIAGLGHGTPLATRGEEGCGVAGPHMLEANISSTRHIARFWGLLDGAPTVRRAPARVATVVSMEARRPEASAPNVPVSAGVAKVIEDALRSAGLMR